MIKRIICFIRGHKYKVLKAFSYEARCVTCRRCKNVWAMNDRIGSVCEWDGTFSEFYKWSPWKYDRFLK